MKRIVLFYLFTFIFLISCSDSTTVFENGEDDIQLETSTAVLDNSINYDESGVLDIYEENQGGVQARFRDEQAGDYPLTLVAQVNPPSFSGGENLTASHVDIVGDYAYVSYNTIDSDYVGGIDIVYIVDPMQPRLTSRLYYINADINSLRYDNGFVYAAGGVDAEKSVTATANSFVAKLPVSNGRFNLSAGITYGFQEGFNANDILVDGDKVLMTSGRDGYITEFDKQSLEIRQESPYADLRSLAISNGQIALLDASFGVRFLDASFNETGQIAIDSDFRLADKRTLDISDDRVVVAEGERGAGIYNAATGVLIEHVPIPINPAQVAEENIVTNATALNENVLLMANGGAGLCFSEDNNGVDLVGIIELQGSINYVASRGDYIFAASGKRGLQIIKMNKPDSSLESRCQGTPNYSGSSVLSVPSNADLAYSGSKRFRDISIEGNLLLCGTWTVRDEVEVAADGLFEMRGVLVVARNSRRRDVTVGTNATLRIEGDLTIYGDLVLEEGASLEFLGNTARVNIFGDVLMDDSATVTGEFDDVQDKF
ncbi:MAG: hypothetical protein AAGH81_04225 [Bacteroidota bacterium]